jgi:hypothetical protein
MFKIYSFLLSVILLSSCSQQNNKSENVLENSDGGQSDVFMMAEQTIDQDQIVPELNLNFGNLDPDKTYSSRLVIVNRRSTSTLVQLPSSSFNIPPYVVQSSCDNVTLQPRRTCSINISINTTNLPSGNQTAQSLSILGQSLSINSSVNAKPPVVLKVSEAVGFNFGTVNQNQVASQTLIVTNQFSTTQNISLDSSSLSGFSLTNSCPAQLENRRSCRIVVNMDSSSLGVKSSSFSVGGNTINLQGEVISPAPVELSDLAPVDLVVDGGKLLSGTKEIILNFKNSSSQNYNGLSVDGLSSPFSLKTNGCENSLARRTCSVVLEVPANNLLQEAPYLVDVKLVKDNLLTKKVTVKIQAEVVYTYNVVFKNFSNPASADNIPMLELRQEHRSIVAPVNNPVALNNFVASSNSGRAQSLNYSYFIEMVNRSTKQVAQMAPVATDISFNWDLDPSMYLFDSALDSSSGARSLPSCGHISFSKTLAPNASCATIARIAPPEISAPFENLKTYKFGITTGLSPAIQQLSVNLNIGRQVQNISNRFAISLNRMVGNFDSFQGSENEASGFLAKVDLDTKNIQHIGTCDLNPSGSTEFVYTAPGNRINMNKAIGLSHSKNHNSKYPLMKSSNGKYYFRAKGCINNSGSRLMDSNFSMWEYDPTQSYSIGLNPKKIFSSLNQDIAGFNVAESSPYIFFNSFGKNGDKNKILQYNSTNGDIHEISIGANVNVGGNNLVVHNSKLYFIANAGAGNALFEYTPGSNLQSTQLTTPVSGVFTLQDDLALIGVGNKLIFSAALTANNQYDIHVFDLSTNNLTTIASGNLMIGRHITNVGNNKVIMSAFASSTSDAPAGEDVIVAVDISAMSHQVFNSNLNGRNLFHDNKSWISGGYTASLSRNAPNYHRPNNTEFAVLNGKAYFRGNTGWFQSPSMAASRGALNPYREFGEISLYSYNSTNGTFVEEADYMSHQTGFVASRSCTSHSANCYDLTVTPAAACNSPFTCTGFEFSIIDDFPLSFIRVINGKISFPIRTMPPTARGTALFDPSAPKTDQDPALGGISVFATNIGSNPMAKLRTALTQRFPFTESNDSSVAPYALPDGRVFYPRNGYASTVNPVLFNDFILGTDQNDMETRIQINLEAPESKAYMMIELLDLISK